MNAILELTEAQRVALVDPNDLPRIGAKVLPLIKEACEWSRGEFDVRTVIDAVLVGDMTLIAYMDGDDPVSIAVLQVSEFKTGVRICEVLLASGKGLKDWRAFQPQVAAWAKSRGCVRFRMIGREGLARMLPDWKRAAVVLEMELS